MDFPSRLVATRAVAPKFRDHGYRLKPTIYHLAGLLRQIPESMGELERVYVEIRDSGALAEVYEFLDERSDLNFTDPLVAGVLNLLLLFDVLREEGVRPFSDGRVGMLPRRVGK